MSEEFDSESPTSVSHQSETKTFSAIILDAIDSVLRDLHVALPAQVVRVRNNSFVDVQVMLKRKYKDGTLVDIPVIQNVPVKNLSGADWWVKCPVAVGDTGTALVHERSLDVWKVSGGIVDPADPRRNDLTDAEFIPGLRPTNQVIPGAANDMVLHNGSAEIYLQKSGRFKVKGQSQELIDLLDQFVQIAETLEGIVDSLVSDLTSIPAGLTTAPGSPIGPNPPFTAAMGTLTGQLSTLSGQLSTLQTNLETLKGT